MKPRKPILRALVFSLLVAAALVFFVVVIGMPVWQAVLLEAVTLATTNMIAGGPRLPPRGRDRTG